MGVLWDSVYYFFSKFCLLSFVGVVCLFVVLHCLLEVFWTVFLCGVGVFLCFFLVFGFRFRFYFLLLWGLLLVLYLVLYLCLYFCVYFFLYTVFDVVYFVVYYLVNSVFYCSCCDWFRFCVLQSVDFFLHCFYFFQQRDVFLVLWLGFLCFFVDL